MTTRLKSATSATRHAPAAARGESFRQWLLEQLESGTLAVGMKLASERELSSRFGLSRGTLRRVVDEFLALGLLRRSVGSGTYVAALPNRGRRERHRTAVMNVSPVELMEARMLFEPLLPGLIIRHATPGDFERMQHCLEEAERAASFEEFEYWDEALHEALSNATHNAFFVLTLRNISEARAGGEWGRLKQTALTPARRKLYQRQHRAVVKALRQRDEVAASSALRTHLEEVRRNLFGS